MAVVEKYAISLLSIDNESPVRRDVRVSVSLPPKVLELPREANKPHSFPEGGLKAYLTVLGASMALTCTFGQLSAFGTYQAWYASHQLQHLSASTISWIGSLQFWIFFFSVSFNFALSFITHLNSFLNHQGAPIGRLYDAHGPTWLMVAGSLCCLISTATTSICKEYYQYILSQGILFGLGVGLLYVYLWTIVGARRLTATPSRFYPAVSSISTHFCKYRATALGFAVAGTGVGAWLGFFSLFLVIVFNHFLVSRRRRISHHTPISLRQSRFQLGR